MQITTGHQRSLRSNRRGVSNIIVAALSLVIIVAIVSNVFLWSYQMNQFDWERTKEDIKILEARSITNSSWFATQSEFTVNLGNRISGTYIDTQNVNAQSENFSEAENDSTPNSQRLDTNAVFTIDTATYPLENIKTVEILLRYQANDTGEKWHLRSFDWTSMTYSDFGFNNTAGHTPTLGWDDYALNLTDKWRSYVADNGVIYVKLQDGEPDSAQTTIKIDFLSIRVRMNGTLFTLRNDGSLTAHIVSIWIINSTVHERYDADIFVSSAETFSTVQGNIYLPYGAHTVKMITERGNAAVYLGV